MQVKNKPNILQKLKNTIVLSAEGYAFELERRGYIKAGAYVPEVVLDYPDALRELHREFLRAGSDVLVALTYYAHREKLRIINREEDIEEMNRQALRIVKEISQERNAFVAGNICNTWLYDPNNKKESQNIIMKQYTEQVTWAIEAGVDFVIAETIEYVGEALIALEVIKKFNLPALINFAPIYNKSKDGYDWIEGCKIIKNAGADIVGFNCSRGPETMLPLLINLRSAVSGPISAVPVPYHTTKTYPSFQFLRNSQGNKAFPLELDPFLCTRFEMAEFAVQAEKIGVNYLGLCCGAGSHHIRAMAEALGRTVPASKYSPDLSQHSLLGLPSIVKQHERKFLKKW